MAAGESYPAIFSTPGPDTSPESRVALDGYLNFTDDTDQPGGEVAVTDGSTTVSAVSEISFTGATVADGGSGVAEVTVGGPTVVTYEVQATSGAPSTGGVPWSLTPRGVIPLDTVSGTYGSLTAIATAPLTTYGAMGTVLTFATADAVATSTASDAYDVALSITVQDALGTQSLTLDGSGTIAQSPTGGSVTIAPGDLTPTANTGSDLAYDDVTGIVSSTAGGSFGIVVTLSGQLD